MTTDFTFVDELPPPPPPFGKPGVDSIYIQFRDALDEQPGRWAIYPLKKTLATTNDMRSAKAAATAINKDRRKTFPADKYEATARESQLYVRRRAE